MNKIMQFIQKERTYLLLLALVLLITFTIMIPAETKTKRQHIRKAAVKTEEVLATKSVEAENILKTNRSLAMIVGLVSLLVVAVLILGIAIDIIFVSIKIAGKSPDIATYRPQTVGWNVWDVAKVVILFLFFGYITIIIEAFLCRFLPLLKNDNFRMILNTSMLDVLTVVFILYFTVGQYREKLISLGISFRNFFKNVFYGIAAYIALVPVLTLIIIATTVIISLTKYVPEKQAVVELFLKEKDAAFLFYTSIFAAIVGPIIEELFFRGFMYNAVKKYTGIFWATMITAALFASLHAHAVGFMPIVALGVLLAYLYEKTGTLISSVTVHIIHNLSMVVFVFLAKHLRG